MLALCALNLLDWNKKKDEIDPLFSARTLCEFQEQLVRLNDLQSINHWEQQAMIMVQRYASDQRQRLRSISFIN